MGKAPPAPPFESQVCLTPPPFIQLLPLIFIQTKSPMVATRDRTPAMKRGAMSLAAIFMEAMFAPQISARIKRMVMGCHWRWDLSIPYPVTSR